MELTEAHAVPITMGGRALVGVTIGRRSADLSENDDTCGTAVDAKCASGTNIVVNEEDRMVAWVIPRHFGADGLVNGRSANQVNALPGTNIDTAFAGDALGLINMNELLGLDRLRQPFRVDFPQDVIVAEFGHRRIGVNAGHGQLFRTRGRPYSEVAVACADSAAAARLPRFCHQTQRAICAPRRTT